MKRIIAASAIAAALGGAACAAPEPHTAPSPTTSATASVYVTIPEVYGRNGAIVVDELKKLGLTNVQLASKDDSTTSISQPQDWRAFGIEPSAGTVVSSDARVVVTFTPGSQRR
ncbi:PASTA domain-containing protein [Rhodococcus sp. DSM 6344]|nr:PASTA domain-containing protein [Rhodococcus erythropolis]